jgi:hypothetical protein
MLESLKSAGIHQVAAFFLIANGVIFLGSIWLCWLLGVLFGKKRIFDRWEPIRPVEVMVALLAVILNAAVSVAGWGLWTHDVIVLKPSTPARAGEAAEIVRTGEAWGGGYAVGLDEFAPGSTILKCAKNGEDHERCVIYDGAGTGDSFALKCL